MKKLVNTMVMIGVLALIVIGFAQTAAAQPPPPAPGTSPSQYCKQVLEPFFQGIDITVSHSTCVTLVNGADGNAVGICKLLRDNGQIDDNQLGECISSVDFGPTRISAAVFAALVGAWLIVQFRRRKATPSDTGGC